jgi:acetyl esterase/lipase
MSAHSQRQKLYELLGDLPPRQRKISVRQIGVEERGEYVLERLLLDLNGSDPVPAIVTLPRHAEKPLPAVLFNHSHGGFYHLGKRELIEGNSYLVDPPYAQALAARGIACLCIDQLNFGERHAQKETELFKELLWHGEVMWGLMVYDGLRAIDYLTSRADIDGSRIATLGISMGSTMSWWLAALDERIRVVIELCCLTDFDELIRTRGLDEHGVYYYVPGLLKHFDAASILELIAPRPFLSLAGDRDALTPPHGLDKLDAFMKKTYRRLGKPEHWQMLREDHAHFETHAMRQAALAWLDQFLLGAAPKARRGRR